jgi:hypothetical protein
VASQARLFVDDALLHVHAAPPPLLSPPQSKDPPPSG